MTQRVMANVCHDMLRYAVPIEALRRRGVERGQGNHSVQCVRLSLAVDCGNEKLWVVEMEPGHGSAVQRGELWRGRRSGQVELGVGVDFGDGGQRILWLCMCK